MPDNDLNGARQPDHATWTDPQYLLNALPDAGGDGQKAESSHDDVGEIEKRFFCVSDLETWSEQSKVLFVLRSLPATAKCRDAVASVTDEFKGMFVRFHFNLLCVAMRWSPPALEWSLSFDICVGKNVTT